MNSKRTEQALDWFPTLEEVEAEKRRRQCPLLKLFPEDGPFRRELYPKHMEFFRAGAIHRERAFIAGNRTGKTEAGAYEAVLHMTGEYPKWWQGKRFNTPTKGWAAGDTNKTVRDVLQVKFLGEPGQHGSGLIPLDRILKTTTKQGIAEGVDTIYVKHVSGGSSSVTLKSYQEGRESFQGGTMHWVWADEECEASIWREMRVRTMTTEGLVWLTFTPLRGLSDLALEFFGGDPLEEKVGRYCVTATWDDCPHLTEQAKTELRAAMPPHELEAREKGIPHLGAGAIYPVPESVYLIDPFQIPDHWPRVYGLDVGGKTACVWGAWDREHDLLVLDGEYYREEKEDAEPSLHAEAIKKPGKWIPGVIDPAARGRSQTDGRRLLQMYKDLGLDVEPADNSVETGIYRVWTRLQSGRLKIFRTLNQLTRELKLYHRDEKGHVVKKNDHLMDAMRYLEMSGLDRAKTKPVQKEFETRFLPVRPYGSGGDQSWMG